jgi:hypothetical protein
LLGLCAIATQEDQSDAGLRLAGQFRWRSPFRASPISVMRPIALRAWPQCSRPRSYSSPTMPAVTRLWPDEDQQLGSTSDRICAPIAGHGETPGVGDLVLVPAGGPSSGLCPARWPSLARPPTTYGEGMTSGPRAIGLVLHPTNLVQPLILGLPTPDLEGGPGRSFRSSTTSSNRQGRPTAMSGGSWRRIIIALYQAPGAAASVSTPSVM